MSSQTTILLAFKAIALSDKLNGTEKQVAAFLVDSFNRRTGQCDPSVETQAVLSTKSRRTIFRALITSSGGSKGSGLTFGTAELSAAAWHALTAVAAEMLAPFVFGEVSP